MFQRLRGLPASLPGVTWPFSTTTTGARVTCATTTSPPPVLASETAVRNASAAAGKKSVGTRIFLNTDMGASIGSVTGSPAYNAMGVPCAGHQFFRARHDPHE